MWRCRHCNEELELDKSARANHSRWCAQNPKREQWNKAQGTVNKYGNLKEFEVHCSICDVNFFVKEREKSFPSKSEYFCGRKCAASKAAKSRWEGMAPTGYVAICFAHHDYRCVSCGFTKVVAVHHVNENHDDNRPENLVPLCPNCHTMLHSKKWRDEILPSVNGYLTERMGI